MKKLLFALLLGTLFLSACDNDDDNAEPTNEVSVIIQQPAANAVFSTNDAMVHVHVDAGATVELHNVSIEIYEAGDETQKVYEASGHGSGTAPYAHHADVDMANFSSGDYTIRVTACGAHMCMGDNKAIESNTFTVQ
ncbi:MAG: hypothetical protein AAGG75_23055 [Bacteroidota bacterium]